MRQTTILSHFLSSDGPSRRRKGRQVSSESEGGAQSDSDSDVRAIGFEDDDGAQDEDDSENDAPQPRRSTRLDSSPSKKRTRISSPALPPAPSSDAEQDQDDSPRASGSRRSKPVIVVDSDSDGEHEDGRPARKRKKVVRGVRPATPDEDEDLNDGLNQDNVLDTRLRGPSKKSKFSQALERMKQRKKPRVVSEDEEEEDDEEEDEGDDDHPFAGAKPTEEYDESDEGSVNDFIVDDEGASEGIVLPSAFRMQQNLSHHFKIICQYYVHLACAKNKSKFIKLSQNNEYFAEPLSVMRRKLSGIQDSLVTSSVWRTDFKNALRAYPDLALEQMTFSIPYCDACHIGGRVSTLVGHLSGSRYDKKTFENIDAKDDKKNPLPMQFHLGRFCARRTRCFHSFAHWEHELYSALQLRVRNIEGWRKSDPDEIMERLDQRGVVEQEWKRMNDMMESARNLEVAAKRGEDDGDI